MSEEVIEEHEDHEEEEQIGCPVCRVHTADDALSSQGIVLTALKAYLDKDEDTIQFSFENFSQYDAHMAVTMYAHSLFLLEQVTGVPAESFVDIYRQDLNATQAGT